MCFYRGYVHRHGFRDRLGFCRGRACLDKLGKLCCCSVIHSHWLGIGQQVNDDPDARTLAAEDEGPQTVVAGQGGDHAVAVGAEVHSGDIRTKSAWNLLKCGAQMAVEHDSQSFLFYPRAVCHGTRPIEHDASKIVMRPGARYHRLCRSLPSGVGRFQRLGDLSGVRLLAVARAVARNEQDGDEQPKHVPIC